MKKYLFIILAILFIPLSVNAESSATITISSSNTNIKQNDIIDVKVNINSNVPIGYYEYTLDYNTNKLKLIKGTSYNVNRTVNAETTNINKTFQFKVLEDGISKISVKSYVVTSYSGDKSLQIKVNPKTISTGSNESTYSNNNYLSKLEVKGYELSPSFDKTIEKYKIFIKKNTNKLNVIAKTEDENAVLTGDGDFEIAQNDKEIKIIVTSKRGEKRNYTIYIESENLKIEKDNKTYILSESINQNDIPKYYQIKNIKINDTKIEALYNENTKYTLVGLTDENNNFNLYVYDEKENTYTIYKELIFDNIIIIPLEPEKEIDNTTKEHITINDVKIICYKENESPNHCLIYGIDTKTGKKDWYLYNIEENTIQKKEVPENENSDYYKEKIKNSEILIYILTGTTIVFGIALIALSIKASKTKKISKPKKEIH